ncbi:MAG: type II secretion system F family protein [Clostridia bacterium]|jgi:tight adherence protein B
MEKRTLAKKKIYDSYVFSTKEKLMYGAAGMIFTFAIGYIFYRRIGFSVLLSFLGLYYLKMKKKQSVKKQKQELNVQFKDLLYFLSTSLSAGRSLENAFESSLESLQRLYGHEESHIVAEVMIILGRLNMGDTVEECLIDFSKRARIEDISNFTDVLVTCKRKGGNVNEVIRNASRVIKDRIEIMQEIEIMLAGKRMEQRILGISPVALILLLSWLAEDFMAPVFNSLLGHTVMTVALVLIALGYLWSKKIMDISV